MRLEVPRTCRFGRSWTAWARATRRNTLAISAIQRISVDRRQARVATRVLGRRARYQLFHGSIPGMAPSPIIEIQDRSVTMEVGW
jgi:hypothetical protein